VTVRVSNDNPYQSPRTVDADYGHRQSPAQVDWKPILKRWEVLRIPCNVIVGLSGLLVLAMVPPSFVTDAICAATILGTVILLAVLALIVRSLQLSAAKTILNRWAKANGYEIVAKELRILRVGPFWLKTRHHEVYYVTIRTPEGQTRRGWVCCGWSAVVRWDE
jgi:hypothetical protein